MSDFEPRPELSGDAEIDRAKGLRRTAVVFAAAAALAAAASMILGHGSYYMWISGAVILVCALSALRRAASEPVPAISPQ
ncbi:hypothetical protein [Rhodococcus sp. PvR044]|uniref:hypothetical protein n=1 Tax=Rhodococcus sp. PvR044 TaxID=3156402 RepID=UPI00339243C3